MRQTSRLCFVSGLFASHDSTNALIFKREEERSRYCLVCKIVTTLPFCVEPGEKLGGHALAIHDHSFHLAVFRVLFIAGQKRGNSDVIRSLRFSSREQTRGNNDDSQKITNSLPKEPSRQGRNQRDLDDESYQRLQCGEHREWIIERDVVPWKKAASMEARHAEYKGSKGREYRANSMAEEVVSCGNP
jgi:hypothetical protein